MKTIDLTRKNTYQQQPRRTTDTASTAHNFHYARTSSTTPGKHTFFLLASANGVLFFFGKTLGKMAKEMPFEKKTLGRESFATKPQRLGHTERREREGTVERNHWRGRTHAFRLVSSLLNYYYWFFLIFASSLGGFWEGGLEDERWKVVFSCRYSPIRTQ